MATMQYFDFDNFDAPETAEEKQARENRLREAEIKCRLRVIDNERIRPLAAIVAGNATDYDSDKLSTLEKEAESLRIELAKLEV